MKTKNVKVLLSAATVLLIAWAFVACSKKDTTPPVVKTELTTSITAANALVVSTHEGVAAGDYLKGSQAPLIAAIAQAQVVADDNNATQVQVTAAIANLAAALATYASNLVTAIDPSNLVGQWTFDEGTGTTVADHSGNHFNGTFKTGATSWGAGNPAWGADRYGTANRAILFDKGANIEVPYNTALNPPTMSISLWINGTENRADNRFIGLQSWIGYKFQLQSANRPFFTANNGTAALDRDSEVAVTLSAWHHLVVTFTDGKMIFYIDGFAVKTWTDLSGAQASISAKPYNLVFGQDFPTDKYSSDANGTNFNNASSPDYHVIPLAWGGYYHGYLDEIRIYKSVLTQAQVTSIYNLEKP
jgi:hypothetical protein